MISNYSTQDSKYSLTPDTIKNPISKDKSSEKIVNKNPANETEIKMKIISEDIKLLEEKFNFKIQKKIGSGGFSTVYLGTQGNKQYAVKMINIDPDLIQEKKEKLANWVKNEKIITMNLRNKNCIKCLNCCDLKNSQVLFLELCAKGDLANLTSNFYDKKLFKINESLKCDWMDFMSCSMIRFYFNQIVSSLEYLRKMNLLHRDLKLENLLITNKNQIKLSDFALSTSVPIGGKYKISSAGTPMYMPPESYQEGSKSVNSIHAFKIDYYALGVVLYRMLYGEFFIKAKYNYDKNNNNKQIDYEELIEKLNEIGNDEKRFDREDGRRKETQGLITKEVVELLKRMLHSDITKRADLDEIKTHRWLTIKEDKIKNISYIYESDYQKFLIELQKLDYVSPSSEASDNTSDKIEYKNINKEVLKINTITYNMIQPSRIYSVNTVINEFNWINESRVNTVSSVKEKHNLKDVLTKKLNKTRILPKLIHKPVNLTLINK